MGCGQLFSASDPDPAGEAAIGQANPDQTSTPIRETATPTITLQEVIVTRVVEYEAPPAVTPIQVDDIRVLDIGLVGNDVETFDPQNGNNENELNLIHNIFVGLTHLNQLTGQIEPQLARSWEITNQGSTWTFKLRNDIYWLEIQPSGGALNFLPNSATSGVIEPIRPVYAEDVVMAVRRACAPSSQSSEVFALFIISGCRDVNSLNNNTFSEIDFSRLGVRVLDPFTVQFDLEQPSTYFLTITSLPIMRAVPAERVVDDTFDDWSVPPDNVFITNGPFLLSPITTLGSRIVLERNPYWPLPITDGIDVVNLLQLNDSLEAYTLWSNRAIDFAPLPRSIQDEAFANSPLKITKVTRPSIFYLAFNHESGIFGQPELRRAFAAAIDRELIVERVYNELGVTAKHLSPPGSFGSPPVDQVGVGYNPDYARQQLVAGGVTACRFLPEIRYMVSSSDAALFQAELIREMWVDELGCLEENILIEQVPFGQLLANTRADAGPLRPDVWDLGWRGDFPDAHNWLVNLLHCSESDGRLRRSCSEIDNDMIIAGVLPPNDRIGTYRTIENRLFGEGGQMPVAPIYVEAAYFMQHTWVDIQPETGLDKVFHFQYLPLDAFIIDAELKAIERRR